MTQQHDRMAKAIKDELKKPQRNLYDSPATLLARVALGVIYMYLILVSYELMGISGPVFTSVLFLVSCFIPLGYQVLTKRLQKRAEPDKQPAAVEQAQQEI